MKNKKLNILSTMLVTCIILTSCKTTTPIHIPDPPTTSLQTVQRVILWGESGTINLQDVINSKRCAMDPHVVIGTDANINLVYTKEMQNAGGKMGIMVHPFYSPWSNGAAASLKILKQYISYYDYVVIDYEARWIDLDFVNDCKKLGKPVIIAPLARADSMVRDYESFSQMEDVIFAWWNYSYQLSDWEQFFENYAFRASAKHRCSFIVLTF